MRRIVTGHNKEGKSIVNIDGPPARSLGEDVGGLFELWNTDGKDVNSLDTTDRADSEVILSPPLVELNLGIFKLILYPRESRLNSLNKQRLTPLKRWGLLIIELILLDILRCTKLRLSIT